MILNSLLVVLICKNRSTSSDKSYKPIILQICIMDMLFLILFTFYMPVYVAAGNYVLYYTVGFFNDVFKNAPMFTQITFITWYCSTLLFAFSPSVQFLYRYLILCRGWKPSYRLYTGFYSLIAFLLLFYTILTNSGAVYVPRTSNAVYREHIFTENPSNVDLLVTASDSSNSWPMIILNIIEIFPVCIVLVCGIRIWLHFRRHFRLVSDSNESNQRLQRQVNYALFIQGGMPVFGNLAIIFLGSYLNMEAEYMSFLLNIPVLVIMFVNPLLTMLLVESYRQAFVNLFAQICKC